MAGDSASLLNEIEALAFEAGEGLELEAGVEKENKT